MFCFKCGAKLVEGALFCSMCGTKQPTEQSTTMTQSSPPSPSTQVTSPSESTMTFVRTVQNSCANGTVVYPVYGSYNVRMTKGLACYTREYMVVREVLAGLSAMVSFSADEGSYDKVFDEQTQTFIECLEKFIDKVLLTSMLLANGIDYIDSSDLMEQAKKKIPNYIGKLVQSQKTVSQYQVQLGLEADSGGYWTGGGFGLTGAIKGAIQAEMLNIGTDLAKSAFKSLTGTTDKDKIRKLKEKLYRDEKLYSVLPNALWHVCDQLFDDTYSILITEGIREQYSFDIKKASAKYNNLEKFIQGQSVSNETILKTLCACIELNPFDYDYYSSIYRMVPENEVRRNLLAIVNSNGTNPILEKRFDDIDFANFADMLKAYTTDEYVLKNHDSIAMNQEELSGILTNHRETKNHEVFLADGDYDIAIEKVFDEYEKLIFVGLKNVTVHFYCDTILPFDEYGVSFENIRMDDDYQRLMDNEKLFRKAMTAIECNDFKLAENLLLKASSNKCDDANAILAMFYAGVLNPSIPKNMEKSEKYHSIYKRENLYHSLLFMGKLYKYGSYTLQPASKIAKSWFEMAIEKKFLDRKQKGEAYYELGDLAETNDKDNEAALKWFACGKELGNYCALYRKTILEKPINYKELKVAAHHDVCEAAYMVGKAYQEGIIDDKQPDFSEAKKYFELAAKHDHSPAMYELGLILIEGKGVVKSPRNAVMYFDRAQKKGYAPAMVELGVCYANGEGVKQDYDRAFQLYQTAAKLKDSNGFYNLGICYYYGLGCDKDLAMAKKLLLVAKQSGNQDAADSLAELFSEKG